MSTARSDDRLFPSRGNSERQELRPEGRTLRDAPVAQTRRWPGVSDERGSDERGAPKGPFKIVILGEGRVGKTSLIRRYAQGNFDAHQAYTQSVEYVDKRVQIKGCQVQLSLWDTAGQERYHALAPIYYRDADGALLVYDITDMESFRRVAKWVDELRVMGTSCALGIVGNKTDLKSQARVPQAEAEAYARSINARHSLASAKNGSGVEETFRELAEDVIARKSGGMGRPSRRAPLVVDDAPLAGRRGLCCINGGEARCC